VAPGVVGLLYHIYSAGSRSRNGSVDSACFVSISPQKIFFLACSSCSFSAEIEFSFSSL